MEAVCRFSTLSLYFPLFRGFRMSSSTTDCPQMLDHAKDEAGRLEGLRLLTSTIGPEREVELWKAGRTTG